MRVLFVTAGTPKAAATRYRVSQYLPLLEERGIQYEAFSVNSAFITTLMIKSPEMRFFPRLCYYGLSVLERFMRSWIIIFKSAQFDRVFLQRVTFPIGLERLLHRINARIIFDIDDAIYLPDREGSDFLTRLKKFIKEEEVKAVLRVSKCVIVENEYIKEYVSQFCSKIYKIPGPIDTERYYPKKKENTKDIVIGWIGSPATTSYLNILNRVFEELLKRYNNVSIHLIGAGNYPLTGNRIKKIPWSYDTEVSELQKFDIGLMSMPDNEWTRGKLGCKMLQYMALGIPTVCSDTRTNREIIESGTNGILVKSENEWIASLESLIASDEMRHTLGRNARITIEDKCSLKKNVVLLLDVLKNI